MFEGRSNFRDNEQFSDTTVRENFTTFSDDRTVKIHPDATVKIQTFVTDSISSTRTSDLKVIRLSNEYRLVEMLNLSSGEAEGFIVEKNGVEYFLKLYNKDRTPKIDVLKKVFMLSNRLRNYVVIMYDFGISEKDGRYYEILEYIKNGNLASLSERFSTFSEEKKEQFLDAVIEQLAKALKALHDEGIIHRDLKPSNILIRQLEPLEVVLADFGISLTVHHEVGKVYVDGLAGSFAYMAPEEFSGYFDFKVDWWHLGMVLYELIVRSNPLKGLDREIVMHFLFTKNVEIPEWISPKYVNLLKGLLTRDPNKRWGYEQIEAWLKGESNIPVYYEVPEGTSFRSSFENDGELEEWQSTGLEEHTIEVFRRNGFDAQSAKIFWDMLSWEGRIDEDNILGWVEAGFKDARDVLKWVRANFEPFEAKVFYDLKISVADALRLKDLGLTAYELHAACRKKGKRADDINISELIGELSQGLKPFELKEWVNAGFSLEEARRLTANGCYVDEAIEWKRENFSAIEIESWRLAGFNPYSARLWRNKGFNPIDAKAWKITGFGPDEACMWRDAQFSPNEAIEWKDAHFDVTTALKWTRHGFDITSASIWRVACPSVVDFELASRWNKNGFKPEQALEWMKSKFTPEEAREWIDNEFSIEALSMISKWKDAGFSASETREWLAQGFNVEEAKPWHSKHLRPDEAREWANFGFNPEQADKLKKYEFIPKEVIRWKKEGFDLFNEIAEIETRDLKKIKEELIRKAQEYNKLSIEEIKAEVVKKLSQIQMTKRAGKYVEKLDDYEKMKIILANDNKALVLAGPGSGKTQLIAQKIAYLILNGVKPSEILMVTFGHKAADEMFARVSEIVNQSVEGLTCGTFHQVLNDIAEEIQKMQGEARLKETLTETDSVTLMEHAWGTLGLRRNYRRSVISGQEGFSDSELAEELYKIYSYSRNTMMSIKSAKRAVESELLLAPAQINEMIEEYERLKGLQGVMDFDDMLLKTLTILENDSRLREEIKKKYKWIIVDEFQDTNLIQLKFLKLISGEHNRLLVIGDDAQSIYSFRGGNFDSAIGILKNCQVYMIRTSYRSKESILKVVNSVLPEHALPKTLIPLKNNLGGKKPYLVHVKNEDSWKKFYKIFGEGFENEGYERNTKTLSEDDVKAKIFHQLEANFIVERIKEHVEKEGLNYSDIAILYRGSVLSQVYLEIEELLIKNGIPYEKRSGKKLIEKSPVRDLLAFVKLLYKPNDIVSWYKLFNLIFLRPRYDKGLVVENIVNSTDPIWSFIRLRMNINSSHDNRRFYKMRDVLKEAMAYQSPSKQMRTFYEKFYKDEFRYVVKDLTKNEIKNLPSIAEAFIKASENYENVREFLKFINSIDSNFTSVEEDLRKGKVVLSTLHQAKGLEWKVVFLIGIVPGRFPHVRARIDEEERLFYVGVSRAKEQLYLIRSPGFKPAQNRKDFLEKVRGDLVQILYLDEFMEKYLPQNSQKNL